MTSESARLNRNPGGVILLRTLFASSAALVVVGLAAFAFSDVTAAAGAVGAGFVTVLVMALGTWVLHAVTASAPGLSLVAALLVYGLQMAAITAFLVALSSTSAWGSSLEPAWVGAGIVVAVLAWIIAQTAFHATARIPLYSQPSRDGEAL